MAPIVVESEVLAGAGVSISAVGDEIAAAVTTLAGALPNGAMAGHDKAGIAFGHAYRQAAQALMDAGAAAASGGRTVGFGVQMSATNYSRADASSTIGGGAAPLAPPTAPGEFDAPSVPSPFGGGVAEPFLWSMVQMLVGDVWPDGDPAQLRLTASVWSAFARSLASIGAQLAALSAIIAAQQIPEGDAMASALSDLKQGLSDITVESVKLGQQIFEFATDIESAQNAIRDLLSRLSPAGIFDGIQAVFSGDAMEELREIAEDIRTVLDDLGRQANARKQSLQDVVQLIDDAVVSLQQKARKEFTDYLGEDVGNAVATVFDTHLNLNEGFIKGAIGTIADLQQLDPFRLAYDFEGAKETWGGMLETNFNASPVGTIINPERAFDTQMEMLKGLVHAEDWTTDRPGLGLGQNMFDVGSALIPGGAASKTTKATSITDDLAEGAGPPMRTPGLIDNAATDATAIAGRAEDIGNKLDNVGDNITPNATPNATGPAIPRGLTEPPSVGDAPIPTPRAPDAPTPHLPDATQGDRTAVAPHNSTPTATPHAPDEAPIDRTPAPTPAGTPGHAPAVDVPASGERSTPAPSPSSAPPASAGPTPVGPAHASEPAPSPAHAPSLATPDASSSGQPDSHGPDAPGTHSPETSPPDGPDGSGGPNADSSDGSPPPDSDLPDGSHGSGAGLDDTPTGGKGPGFDYALPADDALQMLQDPAAELARLTDGKVPQSILDGYDPLAGRTVEQLAQEFTITDSNGNVKWDWNGQAPNNGFAGDPIQTDRIPKDYALDRLGSNGGGFLADEGAPLADRAMPPGAAAQYHTFEGTGRPVPPGNDWVVMHGPAKDAFGQPGGAEQWAVIDRSTGYPGDPVPVEDLIRAGLLRETTRLE